MAVKYKYTEVCDANGIYVSKKNPKLIEKLSFKHIVKHVVMMSKPEKSIIFVLVNNISVIISAPKVKNSYPTKL